jgi:phage FluMu protein Com
MCKKCKCVAGDTSTSVCECYKFGEQKGREDAEKEYLGILKKECPPCFATAKENEELKEKIAQLEQQLFLYKKEFGELPVSAIFDMPKITQNECDIVKSYELGNMKEKDKVIYRAGGARGSERIKELEQQLKEAERWKYIQTKCPDCGIVMDNHEVSVKITALQEQLKTAKQENVDLKELVDAAYEPFRGSKLEKKIKMHMKKLKGGKK